MPRLTLPSNSISFSILGRRSSRDCVRPVYVYWRLGHPFLLWLYLSLNVIKRDLEDVETIPFGVVELQFRLQDNG